MNNLHRDPERSTPLGFARYAADFYAAAKATDATLGHEPGYEIFAPIPVMFLVAQSIELSLKAYLLLNKITLKELQYAYGHSLVLALGKAEELGLQKIVDVNQEDRNVIGVLNELYDSKQLQYCVTGLKTFPVGGPLMSIGKKFVESVSLAVGYERR